MPGFCCCGGSGIGTDCNCDAGTGRSQIQLTFNAFIGTPAFGGCADCTTANGAYLLDYDHSDASGQLCYYAYSNPSCSTPCCIKAIELVIDGFILSGSNRLEYRATVTHGDSSTGSYAGATPTSDKDCSTDRFGFLEIGVNSNCTYNASGTQVDLEPV